MHEIPELRELRQKAQEFENRVTRLVFEEGQGWKVLTLSNAWLACRKPGSSICNTA